MQGYDQIYVDEPFIIKVGKDGLHLACCDCGLIHRVSVKIVSKAAVALTFKEDKRMTAQFRRHHGIEGNATAIFKRKKNARAR
jgi:hypothetical protein